VATAGIATTVLPAAQEGFPMRVGVLDILDLPTRRMGEIPIKYCLTKQYASVMPQAV